MNHSSVNMVSPKEKSMRKISLASVEAAGVEPNIT